MGDGGSGSATGWSSKSSSSQMSWFAKSIVLILGVTLIRDELLHVSKFLFDSDFRFFSADFRIGNCKALL